MLVHFPQTVPGLPACNSCQAADLRRHVKHFVCSNSAKRLLYEGKCAEYALSVRETVGRVKRNHDRGAHGDQKMTRKTAEQHQSGARQVVNNCRQLGALLRLEMGMPLLMAAPVATTTTLAAYLSKTHLRAKGTQHTHLGPKSCSILKRLRIVDVNVLYHSRLDRQTCIRLLDHLSENPTTRPSKSCFSMTDSAILPQSSRDNLGSSPKIQGFRNVWGEQKQTRIPPRSQCARFERRVGSGSIGR